VSAERCITVIERDDAELTAIAACMTALRDLDANAAARVAAYVAERHPSVALAPSPGVREESGDA
jgi:hypothetical protein